MGELAVLMLVANGAALLAGLGVGPAATKFVSSFQASEEYEKMRRAGYGCLVINACATAVLAAVIYLSSDQLASVLFGNAAKAPLLRLITLEIAAMGISDSLYGIITGFKLFKQLTLASIMTYALRQSSVVLFLLLGWGVEGIVIGWGFGDAVYAMILAAYARKFLGPLGSRFELVKLLRFSAPLLLGDLANYAWNWFDRALLLPLVSLAQLGSYNVAVTAFSMLDALPSAISGALFPFYSQFYQNLNRATQRRDLENAVKTASRYVSFFAIPLSVGLAATALPAATLLAGTGYADAAMPLAVLSISLAVACQVRALSQIFVVLGRTVTSAAVTIASILIPIVIGVVAVPLVGILGASLARGASLIIALILSILILRMFFRPRFDLGAYRASWIASLGMAAVVLGLQAVFYSRYLLPVYIVVGGIVFILGLRVLHAINREDIDLLTDFLSPSLKPLAGALRKVLAVR